MTITYNYLEAIKEDVKNYIENEIILSDYDSLSNYDSREKLEEHLNETLFTEDSVTGNASGSYTFSIYQAEEYLCHNWGILAEALEEFGKDINAIEKGAEWCDVTIRCYLLNQAISEVLDEMEENGYFAEVFGNEDEEGEDE